MNRFLILFWSAGFSIGALFYCFWYLHNSGKIPLDPGTLLFLNTATTILWPSSLMLMSLSGEHTLSTIAIVGFSLVANGFVYMGAGYVLGKVFRVGTPSTKS